MEGQLQKRSLTGKRFSGGGLGGRVRQLLGVGAVRPGRDAAPAWHALSCRSWQERPSLCPHAGRGLREPNNHAPCPLWRPQSQSCWWVSCRLLADKTGGWSLPGHPSLLVLPLIFDAGSTSSQHVLPRDGSLDIPLGWSSAPSGSLLSG